MTNNYIHDALNFNIGAHMDAFQGYAGTAVAPAKYYQFNNVLIDQQQDHRPGRSQPPVPDLAGWYRRLRYEPGL